MKKQNERIGICPFCGWKTKVTENNYEVVGNNTILIWCENEKCQEEYVLDTDMKIKNNYSHNIRKEWN